MDKRPTTVHELATQIRAAYYQGRTGEKRFAQMMLWLDGRAGGEVENILRFLDVTNDHNLGQLGICWLDGKGFGDCGLINLADNVRRKVRQVE